MPEPSWLPAVPTTPQAPEAHMRLAIDIALASARHGGGPFGAVVVDAEARVVDVGWNQVVSAHDSTAHAEIVALRRAQSRLGTHLLPGHTLYTSCAPCIQCYGALYWSGVTRVCAAARKEDAEALGFDEGPEMTALWEHARAARGLAYVPDFGRDARALEPFAIYRAVGGRDYSHR